MGRLGNVILLSFVLSTALFAENSEKKFTIKEVIPLEKAHAHNDYYNNPPLFEALSHGFISIEPKEKYP